MTFITDYIFQRNDRAETFTHGTRVVSEFFIQDYRLLHCFFFEYFHIDIEMFGSCYLLQVMRHNT